MRYAIIARNDAHSQNGKQKIMDELASSFIYDEEKPELVISIGGDGTLLEAFHQYVDQIDKLCFVGIHSGSLGFYTDWLLTEIDDFILAIKTKKFTKEHFPLLQTDIIYLDKQKSFLALNEITITDYHQTLALDVYIDDIFFESFRGTGFCVATPSGSTAYNKSLGGALVHPSIATFQVTEIASINNKVYRTVGAPLVLQQNEKVRLVFNEVKDSFVFTNDHLASSEIFAHTPTEMHFTMATKTITFARYRNINFWQRVRRSFIE